uniref:Peptide tyrosine phenylalanine n=1 Tax=Loligo vulgaris TaxID=6622 RepID=PYF_LOLVU|nr:RecName: Full=Peptide tyrosine phenylalanine; AltName: Full=Neuropeptide F-related peptide; AltName: Full=PYF [Loligo vulgaris]prf//1816140A peptide PYF [Loligo vulgaris]
YAIVARPRF